MDLQGKVFLVTGAGSGLGAATARGLHAAGAKVMLVDLNLPAMAAVCDVLGEGAACVEAEVPRLLQMSALNAEIKSINPPADILSAMEKQMRAEREKRATILNSEAVREAAK